MYNSIPLHSANRLFNFITNAKIKGWTATENILADLLLKHDFENCLSNKEMIFLSKKYHDELESDRIIEMTENVCQSKNVTFWTIFIIVHGILKLYNSTFLYCAQHKFNSLDPATNNTKTTQKKMYEDLTNVEACNASTYVR